MSAMKPFSYSLPLHRFDLNLLPPSARKIGSEAFKDAVITHFVTQYAEKSETAIVTVDDTDIRVLSFAKGTDPMEFVQSMLQSGQIKEALPFLEALVKARRDDANVLYDLGIAYSELGRYEDAVMRLKMCVALAPSHSNAWVGIGVAYTRLKRAKDAKEALNKAIELDPANGYAHRNLGAVLGNEDDYAGALPHLREALHQLPEDPRAMFGLAHALEKLDNMNEADRIYLNLIDRFPASEVSEMAREARTRIAQKSLRSNAPGGFRPDVMMYIAGALDTFDTVGPKKRQEIAFEIALLGQRGLDINNPDQKYVLSTLPGKYSGLHLLAIMYTAFKQIDPTLNSGADFDVEYKMAIGTRNNHS
jgi:Flp pilus assembly protein TadD